MPRQKSKRGPDPSEQTIRILWGKAAGICEYKGCTEKLFYDDTTAYEFNAAYIAHIIASSPDGPRGDMLRSYQLSDKIENLMLMCDKHHRLIDREDIIGHSEKFLLEMKRQHENDIDKIYSYLNVEKTKIINFSSPIKGNTVNISYNDTVKAVLLKKQPADQYGIIIDIKSAYSIKEIEHWNDLNKQLEYNFLTKISAVYDNVGNIHMSVFPLAPMPLIIKLGALFGDKTNVDIYQKTRVPDTWEWQVSDLTNKFSVEEEIYGPGSDIALIISLTSKIDDDRVTNIIRPNAIYRINADRQSVDSIKSEKDLCEFWHTYQRVCDDILNKFGSKCTIHLFPAMPVSAAFEVGRRRMPGLYPKVLIYDDIDGFMPTIDIGG